ncbi:hypothetical protein N7449_008640 [Penicillium cf. viridicatum]|uniref:Uncharacterized protein n=1 Tax=Penicillium cf. viridicatum TaxID=2972119 RepID=A0A9W9J9E3_9EURO|nr:hypothetical protein N7449_008640 [Penicillium cf. viridicatum]
MGLFRSKKEAPTSSGRAAEVQITGQQVHASAENALAYPGRERLDVRAPYFFTKSTAPHVSESRIVSGNFANQSITSRLERGDEVIQFYQIVNGLQRGLAPNSTYQRQAWDVGVAMNPFRAFHWSPQFVQQKVAHWGIYIRPQAAGTQSAMYRVFGMNWSSVYGSELILEDAWGTPGEDNKGEWKKLLTAEEIQKVNESRIKETTMYFSLEEFVLTVQWLLRCFVRLNAWSEHGRIDSNPGRAYSLVAANCQHFAKHVMTALKDQESYNWTDVGRLERPFAFPHFEMEVRKGLLWESKTEDFRQERMRQGWEKYKNSENPLPPEFDPFMRSFQGF